jgi:hypothetical protein
MRPLMVKLEFVFAQTLEAIKQALGKTQVG